MTKVNKQELIQTRDEKERRLEQWIIHEDSRIQVYRDKISNLEAEVAGIIVNKDAQERALRCEIAELDAQIQDSPVEASPRKKYRGSVKQKLLDYITEEGQQGFTSKQIISAFPEYNEKTITGRLAELHRTEKKLVLKGMKYFLRTTKDELTTDSHTRPGAIQYLQKFLKDKGPSSSLAIEADLLARNFKPATVKSTINKMLTSSMIEKLPDGLYALPSQDKKPEPVCPVAVPLPTEVTENSLYAVIIEALRKRGDAHVQTVADDCSIDVRSSSAILNYLTKVGKARRVSKGVYALPKG